MPTGAVKTLTERGFGFIRREGGDADLLFHASALQGVRFEDLYPGQTLEFEVEVDPQNPGRFRATKVRPVQQ